MTQMSSTQQLCSVMESEHQNRQHALQLNPASKIIFVYHTAVTAEFVEEWKRKPEVQRLMKYYKDMRNNEILPLCYESCHLFRGHFTDIF